MTKAKAEEKRIYVIVPLTVQAPYGRRGLTRKVAMVAGRLMAQCAHVVSSMRGSEFQKKPSASVFAPTTTIVLSVRNSRELDKVRLELMAAQTVNRKQIFTTYGFCDTNTAVYGSRKSILTAVCTSPVTKSTVDSVLGHLDLY